MSMLSLLALAAIVPAVTDCPSEDPFELFTSNDVCTQASYLWAESGSYADLVVTSISDDYYRIGLIPGAHFSASIDFAHADADVDLFLYTESGGSCGARVDSSISTTDGESVQWTNSTASAMDVYLHVDWYSSGSGDSCANYDLSWATISGPCSDDRFEPNDSIVHPYSVGWRNIINEPATIVNGDDDWYEIIRTNPAGRIYARIDFVHAEGDIDLEIWHKTLSGSPKLVKQSASVEDLEELTFGAWGDYGFYIRVHRYGGPGLCNDYTLTVVNESYTTLGTTVCEGTVIPLSQIARLSAEGSLDTTQNDFRIVGSVYPANTVGYLLGGYGFSSLPSISGANELCISNAKYFLGPGQVFTTGSSPGAPNIDLDLNLFPRTGASFYHSVMPGETWAFQLWTHSSGYNLTAYSDAIFVIFE